MFNSKLKKELQDLRDEFEQYKYDQLNKPKYKEGEVLKGGIIVISVEKMYLSRILFDGEEFGVREYYWRTKALKNKKIINL